MVAYKKSSALLLTTATLAAARNGTLPYEPTVEGTDLTYTTVIPSLCPTGLVPHTYTIKQHCDYAPCEQPAVPYGWEVKTKYCAEGCGPEPTYVPVTECPWENPVPTPACYGPGCYKDEVICPEGNTYTNWYHIPTPEPKPYPPKCEGEGCNPHPEPKPYPPVHPESTPEPTPYTPSGCEGPECPGFVTKVYPPTEPEFPCNTTAPSPPMYTGAGVKTAASGVLGFIAVAIVAFL
ncbi:uncharacterized protein DFL_002426 [Arthrobotrys flagrans]|uniref:Uncharacterized protein n=1 Tax=Arthrobotrys flagrans TaxID=97331 RepID=A0A437AAG4_ARTFL|nr:hypothetical protein DFL_002426 [Arthrobotrys flagrans]